MADRRQDRLFLGLPGHHRALDVENGHALRALTRLLAEELAIVEDDIDQLYDNWFIETCEPWAIPYIGDLVGARPLTPFGEDGGGLRTYVANTLSYRQSKGVAAEIEQLARDVTGWPAVAVEFFQHLIQSQNVNHVRPGALGTVSIRDPEAARVTGGPFETAHHTAAAGPPAAPSGRYNIPNLGVFLWRLQTHAYGFVDSFDAGYLGGPEPREAAPGPGFRLFDPLGTGRPLFNRPRADVDVAGRVGPRHVPAPLDRRMLYRDLEALRAGDANGGGWFRDPAAIQVRLDGAAVPPENLHSCHLGDLASGEWRRPDTAGHVLIDPELGRLALHADDEGSRVETAFAHGAAFDIGGGPYDRRSSAETWREAIFPPGEPAPFRIGVSARQEMVTDDPDQGGPVVATLSIAIARWNAIAVPGQRGLITILDSASYPQNISVASRVIEIPAGAHLVIAAAGWPLEVLGGGAQRRVPEGLSSTGRRPHIRSDMRVHGAVEIDETGGTLTLDGLLVEGALRVADGNLGRLEVRHCTLGASAAGLAGGVRVMSGNEQLGLVADHAILGEVRMDAAGGGVEICGCVVGEDRDAAADPATAPLVVDAAAGDVVIARSTLFGQVAGRTLEAENSVLTGRLDIARRQQGCMRYSYAPLGGRTPRRFRCAPDLTLAATAEALGRPLTDAGRAPIVARVRPQFTTSAYGASRFGELTLTCPPEIGEGAEGGAAMGAGFHLGEPFRRKNLGRALEEYLPFGLVAGAIFVMGG